MKRESKHVAGPLEGCVSLGESPSRAWPHIWGGHCTFAGGTGLAAAEELVLTVGHASHHPGSPGAGLRSWMEAAP